MDQNFEHRFGYGGSKWPSFNDPQYDLVVERPRREQKMLQLASDQIKMQHDCAELVANSTISGAMTIASELRDQTNILENSVESLKNKLSNDIGNQTDILHKSISSIGQMLAIELGETNWILSQQSETLTEILKILKSSRNNEAQQLLRQGVRHLQNEQYVAAEERFLKALEYDTTDYQVLMNLGYIAVHKGDPEKSIEYFGNALSLPENIDTQSRFRATWALARAYYANQDHTKAFSLANKAVAISGVTAEAQDYVTLASYAVLAGEMNQALRCVSKVLDVNPSLSGRLLVQPELAAIYNDVLELLSQRVLRQTRLASDSLSRANRVATRLGKINYTRQSQMAVNQITSTLSKIKLSDNMTIETSNELQSLFNDITSTLEFISEDDPQLSGVEKNIESYENLLRDKADRLSNLNNVLSGASSEFEKNVNSEIKIRGFLKFIEEWASIPILFWPIVILVLWGIETYFGKIALIVAIVAIFVIGFYLIFKSTDSSKSDNSKQRIKQHEIEIANLKSIIRSTENDLRRSRENLAKLQSSVDTHRSELLALASRLNQLLAMS